MSEEFSLHTSPMRSLTTEIVMSHIWREKFLNPLFEKYRILSSFDVDDRRFFGMRESFLYLLSHDDTRESVMDISDSIKDREDIFLHRETDEIEGMDFFIHDESLQVLTEFSMHTLSLITEFAHIT
jgi:hypothetical protein